MPTVQYANKHEDTRLTQPMKTPKRITVMEAWFKGARKVLPQIPPVNTGEWRIEHEEATLEWVRFDLRSREGRKANVVIFRAKTGLNT